MRPWRNLAVAYLAVLSFTLVFQALPPLLNMIATELHLDHAQSGLLVSLFAAPGILLTIPGGRLSDRYGVKKVATISALVLVAGSLAGAAATDFLTLGISRVLAGAGGFILIVSVASLVSSSFTGRNLGIAMGVYGTALPAGTIIAFALFGYVGEEAGWRAALFLAGLTALIPLALFQFTAEAPEIASMAERDSFRTTLANMWPLGMTWLWFNAAMLGFLAFEPEYLVSIGFAPETANLYAGFVMWGALIVSPLVGLALTDRRRKVPLIMIGSAGAAVVLALIPGGTAYVAALIIILGLVAALAPPPIFALPAELVEAKSQGTAFGILSASLNVGASIGPLLIGIARNRTGSYGAGFYLMAVFAVLAALSAIPLIKRRAPGV